MNAYARALSAYLDGRTQEELAGAIGHSQPTVARYVGGRLPKAEIARKIHHATGGEVSFELWQRAIAESAGISEAA